MATDAKKIVNDETGEFKGKRDVPQVIYFGVNIRNRAESIRMIAYFHSIDHDLQEVDFHKDWATMKPKMPQNRSGQQQLPVLRWTDGKYVAESSDIGKFVAENPSSEAIGKLVVNEEQEKMYEASLNKPLDFAGEALCLPKPFLFHHLPGMGYSEGEKGFKEAGQLCIKAMKEWDQKLQKCAEGPFFAGKTPGYGDLGLWTSADFMQSTQPDCFNNFSEKFKNWMKTVAELPGVCDYLKSRSPLGEGTSGMEGSPAYTGETYPKLYVEDVKDEAGEFIFSNKDLPQILYFAGIPGRLENIELIANVCGFKHERYDIDYMTRWLGANSIKPKMPKGQLPVLRLTDGTLMPETCDIAKYIVDLKTSETQLVVNDLQDRIYKASQTAPLEFVPEVMSLPHALMLTIIHNVMGYPEGEEGFKLAGQKCIKAMKAWDAELQKIEDGPFFSGKEVGYGDLALFTTANDMRKLQSDCFLNCFSEKWHNWMKAIEDLPGVGEFLKGRPKMGAEEYGWPGSPLHSGEFPNDVFTEEKRDALGVFNVPRLIYFGVLRARCDSIEMIAKYNGFNYKYHNVEFSNWANLKPQTPKGQLPVLRLSDGTLMPESCDIARYIATQNKNVVVNDQQKKLFEASQNAPFVFAMLIFNQPKKSVMSLLDAHFGLPGTEEGLIQAGQACIKKMKEWDMELQKCADGPFFAGEKPGYGDFGLWTITDIMQSVQPNCFHRFSAKFQKWMQAVANLSGVAEFLASRPEIGCGKTGFEGSASYTGNFAHPDIYTERIVDTAGVFDVPRIIYFDGLRARGDPLRWIADYSGFEYEMHDVDFANWGELKPKTPKGQLPVLRLSDGTLMPETKDIAKYIALQSKKLVVDESQDKIFKASQNGILSCPMLLLNLPKPMVLGLIEKMFGFPATEEGYAQCGQACIKEMRKWDKELEICEEGPFFAGKEPGYGELGLFSTAFQMTETQPNCFDDFTEKFRNWLKACNSIPCVQSFMDARAKVGTKKVGFPSSVAWTGELPADIYTEKAESKRA